MDMGYVVGGLAGGALALVGFLIGRRWGANVLKSCLFAEGYVISMYPDKRHGDGRFVIDKAEEPPF